MKETTTASKRRGFKKEYEMASKTSISLPTVMFDRAVDRARSRGIFKFSGYVQELIRQDLASAQ